MLFYIAAGIIALLGALLVFIGFTGNGPLRQFRTSRGLCGACAYPSPANVPVCPECGLAFAAPSKRRPLLIIAGFAIFCCAPPVAFAGPREHEPFSTRLIPTTLLCLCDRFWPGSETDQNPGLIATTLARRFQELAPWQMRLALGSRFDAGLRQGPTTVPLKWPAGRPLRIYLQGFDLPRVSWAWVDATITSSLAPGQVAEGLIMANMYYPGGRSRPLDIPTPSTPQTWHVPVSWTVSMGQLLLTEETREFTVELVALDTHALTPRSGADLDAAVKAGLLAYHSGGRSASIVPPRSIAWPEGLRIGVSFEILDHQTVVGRGGNPCEDEDNDNTTFTDAAFIDPNAERLILKHGLLLRVTGNEHLALMEFAPKSFWQGQIEIPLDDILTASDDPTRPRKP